MLPEEEAEAAEAVAAAVEICLFRCLGAGNAGLACRFGQEGRARAQTPHIISMRLTRWLQWHWGWVSDSRRWNHHRELFRWFQDGKLANSATPRKEIMLYEVRLWRTTLPITI